MLNKIIGKILELDVTDIFISAAAVPYARVDGEVHAFSECGVISNEDIIAFRNECTNELSQLAYERTGSCDSALIINNMRVRANFFEVINGGSIALRPVKNGGDLSFERYNLPNIIETLSQKQRGLIIVCGATGSGKSTTVGTMVNYINSNYKRHILTIEDPIEFVHENKESLLSQREINSDSSTFHEALRAGMREDPDVIVIGEIRDTDTISTAINAALTGHLVITTLHTNDAVSAVERIINLFPSALQNQVLQNLSLVLEGVVAQRLIPAINGGLAVSCEVLIGSPLVKKYISAKRYVDLEYAINEGEYLGMKSFDRDLYSLYASGKISLNDALENATKQEELNLLVQGMETGSDTFRQVYSPDAKDNENAIDMSMLLRNSIKYGASDLIISSGAPPSIRLDGEIRNMQLPKLTNSDTQQLLFGILNRQQQATFEEDRELDFALAVSLKLNDKAEEKVYRFRMNAFYQRGSVGMVARLIQSYIPTPEELNLPDVLLSLIEKKQGLILVTGPTGSGKTTTLASLINEINASRPAHIVTIEDPIEFIHTNNSAIIEQRELNNDTKDFSTALKHALRQDPDVILVGEMRDVETMAAAISAAETGHLVFATIHTNNAPQTIDRIVDSFPASQQNQIKAQLAGVILGIVSQRLLTRIDNAGRVAAFEIMVGTPNVRALVREGKTHQLQSAIETGFNDGMQTLDKALEALFLAGLIDYNDTKAFGVSSSKVTLEESQSSN